MADNITQSIPSPIVKPITLIPVGLKEAALDSPTFRSGFTHFSEQLELVERWLQGYVRSISKLTHETSTIESLVNGFLTQTAPPYYISEAVLDHDYTLLAMKRYGEGAKDFWMAAISGLKKMEANMVDPIKAFLHNDLQSFKDAKRNLDSTQKQLDNLQAKYSSQAKSKEASSLREDAFQVHEARKAYLKASMDFSVIAPQLRMALDKVLVKVFSDQWRDMRDPRLNVSGSLGKWGADIERVKGWSREIENGEKAFQRELHNARRQIEESAEAAIRPSRELDDYTVDSAAGSQLRGPSSSNLSSANSKMRTAKSEKQGWLNLRTVSGKPSRTNWLRRWFYVKNGIFGWLVQGSRSGGVEESERIGVLLCNVRPANCDDRRYVFEVKTKDTTIVLQAETLPELNEWLSAFDVAKQKAIEDPASTESPGLGPQPQDPAFAITPPSAPEFAASLADSGMSPNSDDNSSIPGIDRISTLPVPGADLARTSFDNSRRATTLEKESEPSRDPASRIIQKLDLHRKTAGTGAGSSPASPGLSGGGIASLIAASHGSMPVGPGSLPSPAMPATPDTPAIRKMSNSLQQMREIPTTSLAPDTLANPPAPTNLSATAVIVNGERGVGTGRADASGGVPNGLMANVWGSTNWGFLNRLERGEVKSQRGQLLKLSNPPSPRSKPLGNTDNADRSEKSPLALEIDRSSSTSPPATSVHRKSISLGGDTPGPPSFRTNILEYPSYYPLQLKTQDAQFRLLFPNVCREEKLVLVFKASWNPNEQQEFPGRVYVTPREIYFYSNHCGMTMTTSLRLDSISNVTAASGRDWDVVFLHLKQVPEVSSFTRIMIKTFLEPLKLLQRRLKYLARNSSGESDSMEEIIKALITMEREDPAGNSSMDSSWENVSVNTPIDGTSTPHRNRSQKGHRDLKTNVLIDRGLYGESDQNGENKKNAQKPFKLPKNPIVFVPSGMDRLAVEKEFDISPKALFHVMFGDKSAVWQLLYHERQAHHIRQGPWTQLGQGHLRRDFEYEIEYLDLLRRVRLAKVSDHQVVDSANEHLLYCISDRKTPWHLPHRQNFLLFSKIVITHVSKSKCKLAIYNQVEWTHQKPFASSLIKRIALQDMSLDALDLADVITDQVKKLIGAHGHTKKAITIFGQIGQQTQVSEFAGSDSPLAARLRSSRKRRTMTSLAVESSFSMLETVATSALQIFINGISWAWKVVNANSVILIVLTISLLVNLIVSSTGASEWWKERKAGKYMARLGIGRDISMTKAIYMSDLDDATASDLELWNTSSSKCRDTFNEIINLEDIDAPHQTLPESPNPFRTAVAQRVQLTRQHLGSQRHDLLVAIRVINSIERELMQAEWEDWLLSENARCRQLGIMLRQNQTGGVGVVAESKSGAGPQSSSSSGGVDERRLRQLRDWHRDYCGSCREQ